MRGWCISSGGARARDLEYLDDRGTLSCIFSFGASHGGGSWRWLIFIDNGASFSRIVGCVQIRETLQGKLG